LTTFLSAHTFCNTLPDDRRRKTEMLTIKMATNISDNMYIAQSWVYTKKQISVFF